MDFIINIGRFGKSLSAEETVNRIMKEIMQVFYRNNRQ